MKVILNYIRLFNFIRKNGHLVEILVRIVEMANKVHSEHKPIVSEVAVINMKDGTKLSDFVSLWAGFGDGNPVTRCSHLKAQTTALKEQLARVVKEHDIKDVNIDLMLKTFE